MIIKNSKKSVHEINEALSAYSLSIALKDPLLHFLVIGVLLFTIEYFLPGESEADIRSEEADQENGQKEHRAIYVDRYLQADLQQTFIRQSGRPPSDNELKKLIEQWLNDELVFREGIAMGVHHNDVVVRNRVVDKTKALLAKLGSRSEPTEQILKNWYASKAENYRRPTLYSFEYLSGDDVVEQAQALEWIKTLEQRDDANIDAFELNQVTKRNAYGVIAEFGKAFEHELEQHPLNQWFAVQSYGDWLLVRLLEKQQSPLPDFQDVRELVERDWHQHQQRIHLHSVIERLKSKYDVQNEAS